MSLTHVRSLGNPLGSPTSSTFLLKGGLGQLCRRILSLLQTFLGMRRVWKQMKDSLNLRTSFY